MNAITQQFILPIQPSAASPKLPVVYPWETTNLYNLCQELYELAKNTGYRGTFNDFKTYFGEYLNNNAQEIIIDEYTGQYNITPLPTVEQILRTRGKVLKEDIIINPIPYYETSNDAGGYTVIIG